MKIQPNFFIIDKKHWRLKDLTTTLGIVHHIVRYSAEEAGIKPSLDMPNINTFTKDGITYYLYLFNTDDKESDWAKFLPAELKEQNNFVQQKISLILFIETEFHLFVIIGGNIFQLISPFIDHSFGLSAYDRIIEVDDDELTSIKSRGITGQRIGMNEQFREDYRFVNYIKFGKVPQELHVKLSEKSSVVYFRILVDKIAERLQITVGKGFKIRKQVDFDTLHLIVKDICSILEMDSTDYLSSYIEIKDKIYIENTLKEALFEKVYNHIPYIMGTDMSPSNRFEFDFCNPNDIEKFYEAEEYQLKEKTPESHRLFATVTDKSEIYKRVIEEAVSVCGYDRFKLKNYLRGVRVVSYNGTKRTAGSTFLFHISAELTVDGESMFLIDTKWYRLKDVFIKDLKDTAERIFKTFKSPHGILSLPWNKALIRKEGEYNMQYDGIPNYIVIDTIIVDGVELCDVLFYDDINIYLAHVKYGFTSKVRELTNQILISAKRLYEAKGGDSNEFFQKIYSSLISKGRNVNGLSELEFINLFNKNINFVLAVTSHLVEDHLIEDNIEKFDSNIARFSLITCSNDMRTNYYDMLITQVPRV